MGQKGKTDSNDELDVTEGTRDQGAPGLRGLARDLAALPVRAWVAFVTAALVVGVVIGRFALAGVGTVSLGGRTTLGAGDLDAAIATYTVNGTTTSVTAREVLEEVQGTSTLTANEDGTYDVPSASTVLSYVQNEVLLADAAARGITASDDEVTDFVTNTIGAADLAEVASTYGVSEDAARSMVEDAVVMSKLQSQVVTTAVPEYPAAPEEPSEGEEDAATAEYAAYVVELLGDEWDVEADDWARTDGAYYATLSGYEISNDAATYAAASAAYSVAVSNYQSASAQLNEEWNVYTDSVLSKVSVQLGSAAE